MRRYRIMQKLALATLLLMALGLFAAIRIPYVEAIEPQSEIPCNFDGELISSQGDVPPVGGSIDDYLLYDYHGGTWHDAEKTADNTDDDLMCWAAAASNVLQWTGWGFVVHPTEGAMTNSDEMFAHFNAHWEDQGSLANIGWMWWFNGDGGIPSNYPDDPPYLGGSASWSEIDVAGGGDFWTPPYNVGDYMHEYSGANTLRAIDDYLQNGWGIALGIYDGGHAITCWGITYNSSENRDTDPEDYYLGVWVTDSDDDKLSNSWDPPPDRLRYYNVSYNSGGFWEFDTYGGGGWHISLVYGLEPFPNTAPTADANGPYTGTEGSPLVFDGSGSSDADGNPLQYRWDFTNDGTWDTAWSTDPSASHTYPDDYNGQAALQVSDYMTTDTATCSVTINNVPPTVDAGPDQTVNEGDTVVFSGSYTDPGTDDTHTIEWYFGDGWSITGMLTTGHVYGDNGVYTVTLTITDDDGGTGSDTLTVTVNNVVPSVVPLGPFIVDEGAPLVLTASATDPGSDDLTVEWEFQLGPATSTTYFNDGLSPDPYPSPWGTYPFTVTDTVSTAYGDNGVYTLSFTATDDDGGSTEYTTTITVNNVAPSINEMLFFPPNPDNPEFILPTIHELPFTASANDPGSDDLTFTWNWDDGTDDTNLYFNDGLSPDPYPSPWGTYPFTQADAAAHVYSGPGAFTVTLTVEDDDGGVDSTTLEVKVLTAEEAKEIINEYIQNLPDEAFIGNPHQRKKAFSKMFSAIDDMLADEEYNGAIEDLRNNVRAKADGTVDGFPNNDWIIDETAQQHICWKMDALTAYLETLL